MALFVANAIELRIGQKILLENVSFEISTNQIIAIVGQNGSGKSSFLKVLAGILDIDGGQVQLTKGVKIGYLAQDFDLDEDLTSEEILQQYAQNNLALTFNSNQKNQKIEKNQNLGFTNSQNSISNSTSNPKTSLISNYSNPNLDSDLDSDLVIKMVEIEEKIEKILTKFQIPKKLVKELSGGQKRKLAIAQSLFLEPEILILDEPTNHLDIESVEIVENILKNFAKNGKSVILVSHDRYFLDNLTDQFWEINNAKIFEHRGKWTNYLQNKQTRLQIMSQTEDKKQAFLKREIEWVRAGVKARSTKDKGRLERFYDLEEQKKFENEKSVSFLLPPILPLGNKILELENVSIELNTTEMGKNLEQNEDKGVEFQTVENSTNNSLNNSKIDNKNTENYQIFTPNILQNSIQNSKYNTLQIPLKHTKKIIQNLNFTFQPKTVLGIIGANGSGKTTLIRAILGQIPFEGKITIGQNMIFNYQDQNKLELNQENSIFEELCESSETLKWGQNTISSRKYLKNLLFENEQILTKIKNLSGGQKARILLTKILKSDGNCLILDEPTNDLDIETIGLLEKSVQNFCGICIVISHDRYFLNQVCTDILALVGNGKFVLSTGNYDEYLGKIQPKLDQELNNFQNFQTTKNQTHANSQTQNSQNANKTDKNSWQENRDNKKILQKIEKLIENLESQIKLLELEFENVNFYAENPDKYNQKAQKLESLKSELDQKLAEWEKLGE